MQTNFSAAQLADPATASSAGIIRACVHCGFCNATCPTYQLLGDELDGPRGRIYLMKTMLEENSAPTADMVKHIDRCLSCLSCMTTCPSGVNYMHLADHARAYIEEHYRRPWAERLLRSLLAAILPYPERLRPLLRIAPLARPLRGLLARSKTLAPLAAMLTLAPATLPTPAPTQNTRNAAGKGRVALLRGCVESVLQPAYQMAATRLLNRAGYDVLSAPGEGCCGALVQHMGREQAALQAARQNIEAWERLITEGGLDAILITASGCGTMVKDYGFLLRNDAAYAARAARISALAQDISEFCAKLDLPPGNGRGLIVAYHPPCSLQHGQKITDAPQKLLERAGYMVRLPAEAHLCCGSAGTYNILQPEIAGQLGARKAQHIARLQADVIATGNIGCATQLALGTATQVVHTIELLDWATGGPAPAGLA